MNEILRPHKEYADCYIDDCPIFSDAWKQHLGHIDAVLQSVEDVGMTLKMSKCSFGKPSTKLLGHIVGSGKRSMSSDKVEAIQRIPEPRNKKELRSFLGCLAYYRGYLGPRYSEIALPLTDLTRKAAQHKFSFTDLQRNAFLKLKELLCNATVLNVPDYNKEFVIHTDASQRACGAVISQSDDTGFLQPVAFYSAKFTDTQARYSTIKREMLAVIQTLKRFDYMLFGSKITIISDHNPLTFLNSQACNSSKLLRWSLFLQKFDIVSVKHIPGKDNVVADFLSRV